MQSKIFQEYDIMDEDQDHVKRKGKLNEVRRYCKVQSLDYTTLWSIGSWWWCQILSANSGLLLACFLGWTQEYLCWFKTANRAGVGLNAFAHAKASYQPILRRRKGKVVWWTRIYVWPDTDDIELEQREPIWHIGAFAWQDSFWNTKISPARWKGNSTRKRLNAKCVYF